MEGQLCNISDNVTDFVQDLNGNCSNSTTSTDLAIEVVSAIGIPICITGCLTNSAVLIVLIRARQQSGGNVLTFIINQSAADLFACIFMAVNLIVMLTNSFEYGENLIADNISCIVFGNALFVAVGITASNFGLVVITLERYFKVVHAVAHRKYYQKWMTSVGVALPWFIAVCLIVLPITCTTRVVDGVCLRMRVWPNKTMEKANEVARFLFLYPIPFAVFAYCYNRIFSVIRHQKKMVGGNVGRIQVAPGAGTSRNQNTEQIQHQETGATTGAKLSHSEMNVLQTMIAVIVCHFTCWTPPGIGTLLQLLEVVTLERNAFYLVISFGLLNGSVNPFVYASRYEVFRRTLKTMLSKPVVASNRNDGDTDTNQTQSRSGRS